MLVKRIIFINILLLISISTIIASSTGKLAGNVTDGETGESLVGANIVVVGRWLQNQTIEELDIPIGAATDIDGHYFILNLAPDRYVVEAKMMGYQTKRVVDLLIESRRTVKLDFTLMPTTLDMDEVVVTAAKEVVKLDVSSSETILNQENTKSLPVASVEQIIGLAPGVQIDPFSNNISIRGGSSDEIMAYLDGFSMKNEIFNVPFLSFNRTAIKEISIQTGGFTAEYGDLRSGVIDVVTEKGGTKYSLSLDSRYEPADYKYYGPHNYTEDKYYLIYGSDWSMDSTILGQKFPHPDDSFMGWPAFANQFLSDSDSTNDLTPNQRRELWRWRHRGREEGNVHNHVMDVTFSGPVPLIPGLGFMVSYRDQQDAYAQPAYRDHFGLRNGQVNLTYQITPNMLLTFMGMQSVQKGMALFESDYGESAFIMLEGGGGTYGNLNNPLGDMTVSNYGLSFKHVLSPSTYYEIRANKTSTDYNFVHGPERDSTIIKTIPGEYYTISEGDTIETQGYWDEAANRYVTVDTTFYPGDQIWCPPIELDETPFGWAGDDIGMTEYDQPGRVNLLQSSDGEEISSGWTFNVRADISHQANKYHLFKAGLAYTESKISRDWTHITNARNDEWHSVLYDEHPKYFAGYIQDRIEFEGLIANVGVRAELFDAGSNILSPDDPFNEALFGGEPDNPFRNIADSLETGRSEKYLKISPRLGISHPISATSKIFFNYGHAYSSPKNGLRYGYRPKTYDWSRPMWIGNGNLLPYKTIQYELGYEQNFLKEYLIHAAIYYKDVTDQSSTDDRVQYFKPYSSDTQAFYYTWTNKNYEDIIGIEISLYKTIGKFITGWFQTEFMGKKEGQIGYSKLFPEDDPNNVSTFSKYSYPDDILWEWQPSFMLNLDLHTPFNWGPEVLGMNIFGGWQINSIFNWKAGDYFTWSPNNDPSVYNNMQNVDYFMTDFNINRYFHIFGSELTLYVNIHNPFNKQYLNTGILRGFTNDKSSEIYRYYNSLKEGDRVGDYEQDYLDRAAERPGENYITRMGGPMRVIMGIRYNIN
ncbi:MAG: carboxypeptidase-like regulatory domain-containing protein [Bacteroidota bacterium]